MCVQSRYTLRGYMIRTIKYYGGSKGRDNHNMFKTRIRESIKVPSRDDDACLPYHMVEGFLMDKYEEYFLTSMRWMRLMLNI